LHQASGGAARDHAVHPLQGRPGAHRKGLRLAFGRPFFVGPGVGPVVGPFIGPFGRFVGAFVGRFVAAALAVAAAGCAGPLATDFASTSVGTPAEGTLRHPAMLPLDGDGYAVPVAWRARHANYGTEELVGAVV